ncbi:MAG: cytochrome c peroxidase [Methylococcales bacterium]
MRLKSKLFLAGGLLITQAAMAHGPRPPSMIGAPIPPVPGLTDGADPIVVNKAAAIALGKALFWDTNVGSDGVACGTCHYHAGADDRFKNQLNPGLKSNQASGQTYQTTASGVLGGPNYTLTKSDFPFHQVTYPFEIPGDENPVLFSSDDVVASAGSFSGKFNKAERSGANNDDCTRRSSLEAEQDAEDKIFQVNNIGTRRIEPRNTPTVINAVFNHRLFWDGRANNIFNGSSPWGERDKRAETGVWVKLNARTVKKEKLHLINSALASQAVAPPVNEVEMSCNKRSFPAIARKLLMRKPLESQKVHYQDSVLGALSRSTANNLQPGLNTTYNALIQKAFNQKYWSYSRLGEFGTPAGQTPYTQTEANFAMFFGLAIQLYESTLISDQAPIDTSPRDAEGYPTALNASEKRGLLRFIDAHCNICHAGPALTGASIVTNSMMLKANPDAFGPKADTAGAFISDNLVIYDVTSNGNQFMDYGYINTGVANPESDPGVAGADDFGNPLSFSEQYRQYLAGNVSAVIDPNVNKTRSCDFGKPLAENPAINDGNIKFTVADGILADPNGNQNCVNKAGYAFIPTPAAAQLELTNPLTAKMAIATKAAFKVPTLRNIELTGPYMHNGSMSTLEQVIEFYARLGNIPNPDQHGVFTQTLISINPQARADLLAFLKTLTDDRVRYEKAPFDHPELVIPDGHQGDQQLVTPGSPLGSNLAKEEFFTIPAVGKNGSTDALLPFDSQLAP